MSDARSPKTIPRIAQSTISSMKLTCVLLIILLYLTWRGTLAQIDLGLYGAQKQYFESFFYLEQVGPLRVPLPGAQLVLIVLALNLLVGGLLRVRWRKRNVGVLIGHLGIQMLLLAGFVKYTFSTEGAVKAYEGQSHAEFVSYHDWELVVGEPLPEGRIKEHLVPDEAFEALGQGDRATFSSPQLPFQLELSDYMVNAAVRKAGGSGTPTRPAVDGFYLEPMDPQIEVSYNQPGLYLRLEESGATDGPGGSEQQGWIWGGQREPLTLQVNGRPFTFDLRKQRYPLGFEVRLDKFTKSEHPGTTMARDYRSKVTTRDAGVEQTVEIMMNEPLRYKEFIFYQSGYGPQDPASREPVYSVLSVVSNPSDQWPLWSCVVISFGLALHFLLMLFRYTKNQLARAS